MSATNRGSEREEDDGYYTPLDCARAICARIKEDYGVDYYGDEGEPKYILEPSVGHGAFALAAVETFAPKTLDVVDLRIQDDKLEPARASCEERGVKIAAFEQDFLSYDPEFGYDLIPGNPPYVHAEKHVRHALTMLNDGGILAFLLRLNFLEGKERSDEGGLWATASKGGHRPQRIYVLDRRPSFTQKAKPKIDKATGEPVLSKRTGKPLMVKTTHDACAYGVFVWVRGIKVLTPEVGWIQWRSDG